MKLNCFSETLLVWSPKTLVFFSNVRHLKRVLFLLVGDTLRSTDNAYLVKFTRWDLTLEDLLRKIFVGMRQARNTNFADPNFRLFGILGLTGVEFWVFAH